MRRLNREVFSDPPAGLRLPGYERTSHCHSGIVHLGVGAFHRAHLAVYTDTALATAGGNWYITGASLRSDNVQRQLGPQNYLFTVMEKENLEKRYRLIQSIEQIIVATQNPAQLIDAMAADTCKIISLTITEKGYCHNPATGKLNMQHPDIIHDLKVPLAPVSAPGFIVAALQRRFKNNSGGLSILSCDNLPANGKLSRQVILDFATELDRELANWINDRVSFPSTMVDRIVPATTESDRGDLEQALGYRDEAAVCCEPFSQWVIEDCFVRGRPAWEKAGALFVKDVHEFETMKLRLLNGSHSTMAYLGFLAGYQYIHQVIGDSVFRRFIHYLMDKEISPTLSLPDQIDLPVYKSGLIHRFENSALEHRTQQIAMDGSQKLPQRLLQPIISQMDNGGSINGLCLAVAGWIRYSQGVDENNTTYTVSDPMSEKLQTIHAEYGKNTGALVTTVLAIAEVFPKELGENPAFSEKVTFYLDQLIARGARKTIAHHFP